MKLYRNYGYNNKKRINLKTLNTKELFCYPKRLDDIFKALHNSHARAIIVGGFVRDALLQVAHQKDIDIEVYGIDSYEKLTDLLAPFGSICVVGKSFGVCKLTIDDIECDFSLPRREKKRAKGHKGFEISYDKDISFKEAFRRRDFTINALGYDPLEDILIDEYGGLRDLRHKTLRAVDATTFIEDPLRILRGVVFAARFGLHLHPTLKTLLKEMIAQKMLSELPKERIIKEFEKLFLRSKKPSRALLLLKQLGEDIYLKELFLLQKEPFKQTLRAIDSLSCQDEQDLSLFFGAMLYNLPNASEVFWRFTNSKKLVKETLSLIENSKTLLLLLEQGYSDYTLKKSATKMQLEKNLRFLSALYPKLQSSIESMQKRAKELDILYEAPKATINGATLCSMGLKPSCEFKQILDELYDLQLQGKRIDQNSLAEYLHKKGYLSTFSQSPHC